MTGWAQGTISVAAEPNKCGHIHAFSANSLLASFYKNLLFSPYVSAWSMLWISRAGFGFSEQSIATGPMAIAFGCNRRTASWYSHFRAKATSLLDQRTVLQAFCGLVQSVVVGQSLFLGSTATEGEVSLCLIRTARRTPDVSWLLCAGSHVGHFK